jgi:hypothetical protein
LASESRLWKSRKAKPASQLFHSLDYYRFLTGYGIRILRARSVAISEPTDEQLDKHFNAEFDLIESLGEFRGISCHPVYGLSDPDGDPDEHDGPYGIRMVAGSEGVLEHFLWHVYAELYDTAGESKARVVSAFGIRFMRYEDRRSVLIEYGIGDVDALLRAVELAQHCIGHSDFHNDHAAAMPSP